MDFGGKLQTVTDKNGYYQLVNVSTGTYTIKVERAYLICTIITCNRLKSVISSLILLLLTSVLLHLKYLILYQLSKSMYLLLRIINDISHNQLLSLKH